MTDLNYIQKVAIVGASGNIGKHITASLLETGKHAVTAITRFDSQSTFPNGVQIEKVNYNDPVSLIDALRGQHALIITLSGLIPKDTEAKLIRAAAEAGVPWVLPNEWSPDTADEVLVKDVVMFQSKVATRKLITDLGKSSFISIVTGFWYEWGLAVPAAFAIDFSNRTVVFFDEGETKVSFSTMPQVGRAVAGILSLPVNAPSSSPKLPNLSELKDQVVYVNSFTVSQKDMFHSALRVTGTSESDWTVSKEPAAERYATGLEQIKEGQRIGFAKMMFTRVFFDDGCGDFESRRGTLNKMINLGSEADKLDVATELARERAKSGGWVGK